MSAFHDLTAAQLRHVIHLKERIEYLQGLLASLGGAAVPATATKKKVGRPRTESPGTRGKKIRSAMVKSPVVKKGRSRK